ncbi:MAG: M13 family metallopeptidase [Legionella sp.]
MGITKKLIAIICQSILINPVIAEKSIDSLHLDWLNPNVKPSDDFYEYANGGWLKMNPIPADYARWGTFNILYEKTLKQIHQILIATLNKTGEMSSVEQKVGDFYFSGMNESAINEQGVRGLREYFIAIDQINNRNDLQRMIARLHEIDVRVFFNFSSMQDYNNSDEVIAAMMQGGLGLPNRDYYLNEDSKFKEMRLAYVRHIAKMFELLGDSPRQTLQYANMVMDIETTLAKNSMGDIEQRDPKAVYHRMSMKQLAQLAPQLNWADYFSARRLVNLQTLNVGMPDFIKKLGLLIDKKPIEQLKLYLKWSLISEFSPYLSSSFELEHFHMMSILTGVQQQKPRWQRVLMAMEKPLGFAIGELYVKRYFSAEAKRKVLAIVHNIRDVLKDDLKTLSWMSPTTREEALKKLLLMENRVGYPDKWWDYTGLTIDKTSYVSNVINGNRFLVRRDLNKIGKPVDRGEWNLTPQTINAYYEPSLNSFNLPSAILQPPFFDLDAPAALNYGAIGYVIGHEITHGFDDQGAKFDGHGNLKNWWSRTDFKKFQQATSCIANQFSQYKINGLHVQGQLVVGEATADLGGLTLAYLAFHRSNDYKKAPTLVGITPDQQFFLAAAHIWAMNSRSEMEMNLITVDPHPPEKFRVNGTVANMPAFQQAFGIAAKKGNQCVIW